MTLSRHNVTTLFNRISPTYDKINRILSFGMDQRWRKSLKKFLPTYKGQLLVDLATGTGDQILALEKAPQISEFKGFDLAENMLLLGREKFKKHHFSKPYSLQIGNALSIPLDDNMADVVTISFGIRNVTKPSLCLKEMSRILKPQGRALILEFSRPQNPLISKLHLLYLRHFLPRIGAFFSKDKEAYRYLNETIESFPYGETFLTMMKDSGFFHTTSHSLFFGVVTIYVGEKNQNLHE